jgi:hypothetical protein
MLGLALSVLVIQTSYLVRRLQWVQKLIEERR